MIGTILALALIQAQPQLVLTGVGHEVDYWVEVLRALRDIDPDMVINIEHEDAAMPTIDGLRMAAETLQAAQAKL